MLGEATLYLLAEAEGEEPVKGENRDKGKMMESF